MSPYVGKLPQSCQVEIPTEILETSLEAEPDIPIGSRVMLDKNLKIQIGHATIERQRRQGHKWHSVRLSHLTYQIFKSHKFAELYGEPLTTPTRD